MLSVLKIRNGYPPIHILAFLHAARAGYLRWTLPVFPVLKILRFTPLWHAVVRREDKLWSGIDSSVAIRRSQGRERTTIFYFCGYHHPTIPIAETGAPFSSLHFCIFLSCSIFRNLLVALCKRVGCAMEGDQTLGRVNAMFNWAAMNGAEAIGFGVRETPGCSGKDTTLPSRTIYAKREIVKGETILRIPKELVLSESVARKSKIGDGITRMLEVDPRALEVLGEHTKDKYVVTLLYMMAFLIYEKWNNPSSFWKYYIDSLPDSFKSLPISWGEKDLVLAFNGTSLLHTVMVRKLAISNLLTILKNPILREYAGSSFSPNIDQAMWAYSVVSTRTFFFQETSPRPEGKLTTNGGLINTMDFRGSVFTSGMPKQPDDRSTPGCTITMECAPELCLVPVLDMLNHCQDQSVNIDISRNSVVVQIGSTIKAGDEIFNNYGNKGNEVLLANYGFVIEHNKLDFSRVKLKLSGDEFIEEKIKLIESPEINASLIHILFEEPGVTGIDEAIMKTMRILCFDGRMLPRLLERHTMLEISDIFSRPISTHNEVQSLSTMWLLFANKLKVLTEPREPGSLPDSYDRMVEIYRSGQIRIYSHHLKRIDDAFYGFFSKRKITSDNGVNLPLVLTRYSLNIASNGFLSGMTGIERLSSELEEGTESDLIIPMLLIDIKFRGPKMIRSFISRIEHSPPDGSLEEFFENTVKPLINEFPQSFPNDIYTLSSFIWAASVFEANRTVIHEKLFEYIGMKSPKRPEPLSIVDISDFSSSDRLIPCCIIFDTSVENYDLDVSVP